MDSRRFDDISRRLAGATSRRGALAALVAAGIGLGAGGRDAEARKRCRPRCGAEQTCRKGTCVCAEGTACGAACCRIGQACQGGQCVTMPEPATCVAYGEPCKDVGKPCCENLQCGSGQGGGPVACWVRKTGACTSTAECIYGTDCTDGICVGLPPTPTCVENECVCSSTFFAPAVKASCVGEACACTCKEARMPFPEATLVFPGDQCSVGDGNQCWDMQGTGIGIQCAEDSTLCCYVRFEE